MNREQSTSVAEQADKIVADWQPGVIDLAPGYPDPALLPLELLRGAASSRFGEGDLELLQYGPERGSARFLEALSRFLESETGEAVDPSRLFVTGGASQALELVCALYSRPGDTVLVTDPTYFLALEMFEDRGLVVKGVSCGDDGPDLAALGAALEEHRPAFFYLIPTFGNPTGVTVSPERLERIVELTAEAGVMLVADEAYRLLPFGGEVPASAARADRDNVVSLNSFSKVLAPGLRLGWITAPDQVLRRVEDTGYLRSGGGLNPVVAALVGQLMSSGAMAAHLAGLRPKYAARAGALVAGLAVEAPELSFRQPEGGYFVWAELAGADPESFRRSAEAARVGYAPGGAFSTTNEFDRFMRLSFSHYAPETLAEGAARLGAAVREVLQSA